jgi:hypothetical protein
MTFNSGTGAITFSATGRYWVSMSVQLTCATIGSLDDWIIWIQSSVSAPNIVGIQQSMAQVGGNPTFSSTFTGMLYVRSVPQTWTFWSLAYFSSGSWTMTNFAESGSASLLSIQQVGNL